MANKNKMPKGKSTAIGRIFASLIHDGLRDYKKCKKKLQPDINASYIDLYGCNAPDYEEVAENWEE